MNIYYPATRSSSKPYVAKKLACNFKTPIVQYKDPMLMRHPTSISPRKFARPFEAPPVRFDAGASTYLCSEYGSGFEANYSTVLDPMECEDFESEIEYWTPNQSENTFSKEPNSSAPKRRNFNFAQKSKQPPTFKHDDTAKRLRQSVLKMDNDSGLSFKLEQKPVKRNILYGSGDIEQQKQLCPLWGIPYNNSSLKIDLEHKDFTFPRIFTVTVEKLLNWPEFLTGSKAIFELYGILENVCAWKCPTSKRITLKDEKMKNLLQCVFYEIDRKLEPLERGQWQRCVVIKRERGSFQCLKIRSASPNELKSLDSMVTISSKAKALMLKNASSDHQPTTIREV